MGPATTAKNENINDDRHINSTHTSSWTKPIQSSLDRIHNFHIVTYLWLPRAATPTAKQKHLESLLESDTSRSTTVDDITALLITVPITSVPPRDLITGSKKGLMYRMRIIPVHDDLHLVCITCLVRCKLLQVKDFQQD